MVVPISFVFEHMGTLNEMDKEFAELAAASGITSFTTLDSSCFDGVYATTDAVEGFSWNHDPDEVA